MGKWAVKRKCTALEQSKFLTSTKCFWLRILELINSFSECDPEFCFCLYLYVARFWSLKLCIRFSYILCLRSFSKHNGYQNYRVWCVITKATEIGTIRRFESHDLNLTEGFLNTYPVNVKGYCGIVCLMLLLQPPISPTLAKLVLMLTEEVGNKKTTFMAKSWPWPFIC